MQMSQRVAGATPETPDKSAFATPEIDGLFEEWLRTVEDEIGEVLKENKAIKPPEIAAKLRISEKSVNFFLERMKKEGKPGH